MQLSDFLYIGEEERLNKSKSALITMKNILDKNNISSNKIDEMLMKIISTSYTPNESFNEEEYKFLSRILTSNINYEECKKIITSFSTIDNIDVICLFSKQFGFEFCDNLLILVGSLMTSIDLISTNKEQIFDYYINELFY